EPLKTECQHFLDCIRTGADPVSCGVRGTELVRILEASSLSLRQGGAPVDLASLRHNGHVHTATATARRADMKTKKIFPPGIVAAKSPSPQSMRKNRINIVLNGDGH